MHITRHADYALRVLVYLGINDERQSTIAEIAERFAISKSHLMKVVQSLNALGYVQATRGKKGGLRLGREAQSIPIGEVVRAMEKGRALVECFGADNQCVITPACRLQHALVEAQEAFYATLDQYSLADCLGEEKPALIRILQSA